MKLRALGVLFVVAAGLLAPHGHARPVAMLVQTVDHAVQRAEGIVDTQHARAARALDAAVAALPAVSPERKQAALRCIDYHLDRTQHDLLVALATRDRSSDARLAHLSELEVGEYRVTRAHLLALRRVVSSWS